ncbi:MAG: phenylalanine--tRNA ligase subunit beta [Bacteroidales bacterium]|jgi:phenylalanyl-tRNA synthetase beta chain|nr:phenylalanine--tRNA ligase subunit beta [Bacteroidales bacterium]MDD3638493.1 phenylalanine--tRNA ligase subunit beta [Bacteroidales bacterium]MDD3943353.1 phenylalanine--tRNA ligase subunit beta [Bacteroidales bacterium]MDD4480076.1 phenylalanine--tRNA ligase subunit beta [Bacteroidales bacterium]MDD5313989.1 phenylalanine--tRNA ligase subunit beta [Bacteroidales bacterium]
MKILYNWLKDYIPLDMDPEQTARVLTDLGLEVEGLDITESVPGGLKGVVTARVVTCEPHPGSDHLSLTTVDTGDGDPVQVVCGAPNVAAGQKVLLATVGTQLTFTGGEQVKIKKSKIRGAESFGMICAEDELGIGTSHEGIMVLPPDTPVGMPAAEYLDLPTYAVFEIGLTPNRVDAASHIGVARDLAAWYASRGKPVKVTRPGVEAFREEPARKGVEVIVEAPEAAPRYSGITLSHITVAPSPGWMQDRLRMAGIRPINNVVDITNYVLLETGQPLHAFDRKHIDGDRIVVRFVPQGTRFVTLDEAERVLDGQDLMICNASEPMCIGGVFGGLHSGVTENTTSIFLESAYFHPACIRRTSKRHGLKTDASFRFERGADPDATVYALKRAVLLMQEICGACVEGGIADLYPRPVKPARIVLNYDRMFSLMGKDIGKGSVDVILKALDMHIVEQGDRSLTVEVPPFRVDVQRECDVVEDLLRIYGYNNIELPERIFSSMGKVQKPEPHRVRDSLADRLAAQGFREIMCNSLTRADYYRDLETYPAAATVRILNPLSSDLNAMRQTLLWGGLETIAYNNNRQQYDLRFFEQGNVYQLSGNRESLDSYREYPRLALFITGNDRSQGWHTPSRPVDFFQLKAYVEHMAGIYGLDLMRMDCTQAPSDLFDEGIRYVIKGKVLADLGRVSRSCLDVLDIKQNVYAAEIHWNIFFNMIRNNGTRFTELPRFPEVRRDLALILDEDVAYEKLYEIAFRTEKHLLKHLGLFDVYKGKGIPEGKKQYALSFVFRDPGKTLTDAYVEQIVNRLLEAFQKETGAVLR